MLVETIEHYLNDFCQPAYVSKAFDRVCYNELFTLLIKRNISHFDILFILCMYTNQFKRVRWKENSYLTISVLETEYVRALSCPPFNNNNNS